MLRAPACPCANVPIATEAAVIMTHAIPHKLNRCFIRVLFLIECALRKTGVDHYATDGQFVKLFLIVWRNFLVFLAQLHHLVETAPEAAFRTPRASNLFASGTAIHCTELRIVPYGCKLHPSPCARVCTQENGLSTSPNPPSILWT